MIKKNSKTRIADAMERTAEHYAHELDAQFRTLNNFVSHGGEVDRAHEYYLRGVLSRFLPDNIKVGSGFIASPNWTSRQQDILIYKRDFTTLFQVGDCVVVDYNALVGTIEVKTTLDSDKCIESLRSIAEEDPNNHYCRLPHVIYIRGKYLLMAKEKMTWSQPPFSLWRVGQGGITEGQALLGLVCSVWTFGLPELLPWWLLGWHDYHGHLPAKSETVPWPKNLSESMTNCQ